MQLMTGFSAYEIARRRMYLKRKKCRLQQQLKRKKWIAQLKWAKFTGGGLGLNVGGGTWRAGRLRFRGLQSLIVPLKSYSCPVCPFTTFSSRIILSVHRVTRHPPRKHGRQNRLRCIVCGKRSRRLLTALRHRAHHLSQGAFSCSRCPSRFWNGTLLQRHRFACQRVSRGIRMSIKGTNVQKTEDQIERSTVVTGYRH